MQVPICGEPRSGPTKVAAAGRPGGSSLRQRPLASGFMSIPICVSLLPDRANTCVGLYVLVTFAV